MKRFWKSVETQATDGGWRVLLDSRPVNTPARRPCVVPVEAMASEIAREWDAQEGEVVALSMPMTRTAATCLDRVAPEIAAVAESVATYGAADLTCYRAGHPAGLVTRQKLGWDPLLAWSSEALDAPLSAHPGVIHVSQPAAAIEALAARVRRLDAWALTAVADLTTISGSLLIALAVLERRLEAPQAWRLARIDEDWNVEEWGEDADAAALAARREAD
ncbi:MAG: ATP12 family chaperone protein, partial [Alphaproteobacteria bacterium]